MANASTKPTNALDRVYAQALYELAESAGALSVVTEEVESLVSLLAESDELAQVVSSKLIRPEAKAAFLQKVFSGKASELVYKFIQTVNRKGRLSELPTILKAFQELGDAKAGKLSAKLTVANELSGESLEAVRGQLSQTMGKDVSIDQTVDASLIGGVVLKIGDELIDGSVATRLKTLKNTLVAAGVEKARQSSRS